MEKESNTSSRSASHHPVNRRVLIALYILSAAFFWVSQYLYVPTLPVYIRAKTDNLALIGVVLAMYGLWQAVIRLPLGIVTDWLGRRKMFIIACFLLAGIGAWMMGTADGVAQILIGRSLTGLASGSWVLVIVAFSSLYPQQETVRASAIMTFVSSASKMLATAATGFLNQIGGYSLAFFSAAATAILAIVALLPVREEARAPRPLSGKSIFALISRRDVLLPSILSAIMQYVFWGVSFGFLPILAKQLGASDVMQSALVTMHIAVSTLGNLAITGLLRRIGNRNVLMLSFALLFLATTMSALAPALLLVFVGQFLLGLGAGFGYPALMGMSIQHVDQSDRGTAMGLHQAIYGIGMFAGPWLSGMLANLIGIRAMFGVTGLLCLLAGAMSQRWLKKM